jgi:hypothetical protein
MAAELLLINPRSRRKRSTKRRTMSALQRKYFGKRRSRVTRVRRNPRRRSRARAVATPIRRRRRTHRRSVRVTRARRNPRRVRNYARRAYSGARGIMGGAMGFAKEKLLPGAIGGAGALAVDLAWPYASPYLPSVLTTGAFVPATRIGLAVAIGYAGRMIGGRKFGDEVMNGAIIVTLYDLMKGYAVAAEPAIFGTPAASQSVTARVAQNNMCNCYACCNGCDGGDSLGMFMGDVGWVSPGRQVGYAFRR